MILGRVVVVALSMLVLTEGVFASSRDRRVRQVMPVIATFSVVSLVNGLNKRPAKQLFVDDHLQRQRHIDRSFSSGKKYNTRHASRELSAPPKFFVALKKEVARSEDGDDSATKLFNKYFFNNVDEAARGPVVELIKAFLKSAKGADVATLRKQYKSLWKDVRRLLAKPELKQVKEKAGKKRNRRDADRVQKYKADQAYQQAAEAEDSYED